MTEGKPKPAFKRRKVYIDKKFQTNFIFKFCVLILVGSIASTIISYWFTSGTLTATFKDSRLLIQDTASAILPAVVLTNLITLGLISLAVIFVTLYVSHKISGPLYRFEMDFKVIGGGDLTKQIFLRGMDQLRNLATSVNAMTSSLRDKTSELKKQIEKTREVAEAQHAPQDLIAELEKLDEIMGENFKL